jgi:hypothetical protein
LDSFSPDNEVALTVAAASLHEFVLEHLHLGSHDGTHVGVALSDEFEVTVAIVVDHLELKLLLLLEVVSNLETLFKVRVEVVLDLFG